MLRSAGILLYRRGRGGRDVFLVHPGGPYWAKKEFSAWSIPKGLVDSGESDLAAARREFYEETGKRIRGRARDLGLFPLYAGKVLHVFAVEGDFDSGGLVSNSFAMIWPPKSGKTAHFPEADRGQWFAKKEATARIVKSQRAMLAAFYAR